MPEDKPEKAIKIEHTNTEEFIALGVAEIAMILGQVLEVTHKDKVAVIEGVKFHQIIPRNSIILPGRAKADPIPCVLLKLAWKDKEKEDGKAPE